jgi:hypothetical protein
MAVLESLFSHIKRWLKRVRQKSSFTFEEKEDGECNGKAYENDHIQPLQGWKPFEKDAPQNSQGSKSRPYDFHNDDDPNPCPDTFPIGHPRTHRESNQGGTDQSPRDRFRDFHSCHVSPKPGYEEMLKTHQTCDDKVYKKRVL